MKRIYSLLYIIMLATVFSSCTDFLDLPPKNVRAVSGVEDIRKTFAGYLGKVANSEGPFVGPRVIYHKEALMMFEAYSDNIDFEQGMEDGIFVSSLNYSVYGDMETWYADYFLWNNFNVPEQIWNDYYEAVGFMNTLIELMKDFSDGTQEESDQLEGEMRIHRAHYLFKLLQYFAPYDNAEMGIPFYLHSGGQVVGVPAPRKSHAEIYSVILNDLNTAKEMLARTSPKEGFNLWYDSNRLNNLLAQVYWFKAESPAKEDTDYENAKSSAQIAIDGMDALLPTTTSEFQLVPQDKLTGYPGHFQTTAFGAVGAIFGSPWGYQGYHPNNIPLNQDFLDLFTSGDIRFGAMVNTQDSVSVSLGWPDGIYNGGKYGNFHMFQPEEAYLILAEAQYKLGDESGCISVLNQFKGFRNAGTADGLSGENLLQEIKNERRKEFFGNKDRRWLDLKRYADKTITRTILFFDNEYSLTVEPNNYRYALPIPFEEVNENPDMIPNEGWLMIEYK